MVLMRTNENGKGRMFQTIMPTMGFFGQSMVEKMDIHIQKKQPLTTSTIEKTYFY